MNSHDSQLSLRLILDRLESLEASHHKLRQQFRLLVQGKTRNGSSKTLAENEEIASDSKPLTSFPGRDCFPGSHSFVNPYRSVLGYMGHAVHVSRTGSGEIIYWNFAAEKLYGYKDYEVVGQSAVKLLFDEEHHALVLEIMYRLSTGESWSGQLPLKKRSGQSFMAMVDTSPLYEEGKVTGIVTVSSDATVFNKTRFGRNRTHNQNNADQKSKFLRRNVKKIQLQPQARVLRVPEPSSSISNLNRGDVICDTREIEESEVQSQDAKADRHRPPRAPAVKIPSKVQKGAIDNSEKVAGDNSHQIMPYDDRTIRIARSDDTCFLKESCDRRPTLGDGSGSGPHSSRSSDCHTILARGGGNGDGQDK